MKSLGVALFAFYVSYSPVCRSGENSGFLDIGHTGGTQQGKMQIVLSGLLSRASTGFESAEDTLRQQG